MRETKIELCNESGELNLQLCIWYGVWWIWYVLYCRWSHKLEDIYKLRYGWKQEFHFKFFIVCHRFFRFFATRKLLGRWTNIYSCGFRFCRLILRVANADRKPMAYTLHKHEYSLFSFCCYCAKQTCYPNPFGLKCNFFYFFFLFLSF